MCFITEMAGGGIQGMLLGMDLSFYSHSPALKEIKQTGKLNFIATTRVFQLVNS